jgi:hypothetical protein
MVFFSPGRIGQCEWLSARGPVGGSVIGESLLQDVVYGRAPIGLLQRA